MSQKEDKEKKGKAQKKRRRKAQQIWPKNKKSIGPILGQTKPKLSVALTVNKLKCRGKFGTKNSAVWEKGNGGNLVNKW